MPKKVPLIINVKFEYINVRDNNQINSIFMGDDTIFQEIYGYEINIL